MSLVHLLLKVLCSINGCQRQYSVLPSYIRHFKQQQTPFWDTHWNMSKETALSNYIHNNSSAEMIPAVDFDSSLQSSSDEFSEETFDKLTETLSFDDLVLTFLLELRELKKASGVSCEFLVRSISSLLEATNIEQKIEVDRLLKEFMLKAHKKYVSTCNKIFLHLCRCKKLLRNFLIKSLWIVL